MEYYSGILYGEADKMAKRRAKRIVKKATPKVDKKDDVLIVNRFETLCGQCRASLKALTVVSCSTCNTEFKRVTTECTNVGWLPDSIRAQRPDLEWMDFNEYIG
jgi:hypothetical protein